MKRTDGGIALGSALGAVGAALTAALATLCCAGPAVVAVIGAGGALTAAQIEPYRPYLLTGAIALLALGFWRSYRPAPSGAACSVRTGRVVRPILWLSAIITLASIIAPRFWT
jgi:mercuric ion transport protein